MSINESGNKNDPLVLLVAPMMVSGEDPYQLMHPYLKIQLSLHSAGSGWSQESRGIC